MRAADRRLAAGDAAGAAETYRAVLAIAADAAEIGHCQGQLGGIAYRSGDAGEAEERLRAAIAAQPRQAAWWSNLALVLREQGRTAEALSLSTEAWRLAPTAAAVVHADVLEQAGDRTAAADVLRAAIAAAPEAAALHERLAVLDLARGDPEAALPAAEAAAHLAPGLAGPANTLGVALRDLGRTAAAESWFQRARMLPGDAAIVAAARFNAACMRLAAGDLAAGFADFDARFDLPGSGVRRFAGPLWDGRPGVRVLVHAEQGLGDCLQVVRFLPAARRLGAELVVEVPPRLRRLLAPLAGADALERGEPLPAVDGHMPMMSLPRLLGATLDTLPPAPYLAPEPDRLARWRAWLPPAGLRIGVALRPNAANASAAARRIAPAALAPIAAVPGVRLVALDPEPEPGLDLLRPEGLDRDGAFLDTAALAAGLDLVIACDSAVAHLAGAVGARTWVALPAVADWRWLTDRADSPWYPTLRLFRQPARGAWAPVVAAMAQRLAAAGRL